MEGKMKLFKVLISAIALLATLILPAQANNPNCTEVDGDYIVSFPRGISIANEMRTVPGRPVQAKFTYSSVLNGFAATLTAEQACAFKRRPGVTVELDGVVEILGKPSASSTTGWYSWGLDRIDETTLPLDKANFERTSNGTGVTAYVIDTGIYAAHQQFGGRVQPGFTAITDGRGTEDCNGHGTHVAGTIGGADSGVANAVKLVPVRVLNCRGSGLNSGVISGVDWVYANVNSPAVVNMSLGGGISTALDSSVANLINEKGITVVVAAGNSNVDASTSSPARVPEAITVGATNSRDTKASFSNFGSIVDVYAPGVGIKSAWIGGLTASKNLDGTSMASPHVAGIVARYLGASGNGTKSPVVIQADVKSLATVVPTLDKPIACLTGLNECRP